MALSASPERSSGAKIERVVIVGGGFSGAIQAINLLRHDGPSAMLVERRPQSGRGVAFSALLDDHLLNVRASNMSPFHDDPGHFVRWLNEHGLGRATDFVSRRTYGDYLTALLGQSALSAPGRLTLIQDEAVDIERAGDGLRLCLGSGAKLEADAIVLAVGNLPPHQVPAVAAAGLGPSFYAPNPWSPDIAAGLHPDDDVLIIGTGLTMVDAALFLDSGDFRGCIYAMSRRGLLPRAHTDPAPPPPRLPEKPGGLSSRLLREVRARGETEGWRNAVDELRPYTQSIWGSATHAEQRRFLRHLRPWWDVHRHRIAPQVAARLDRLRAEGRLIVLAGAITGVQDAAAEALVCWRPRGADDEQRLSVRRIVNCTGPQGDLIRTKEPLLRALIERGMIRSDTNRLGIDVNQQGEVIDAGGRAQPQLLAIGPMTRGAFWEIVAVPDIRVQSWALARRLSNAHWVGGEGL